MDRETKVSRIMLTVNLNRKQFRIVLNLKSTKADYDKAISVAAKNLSDDAKQVRKELNEYLLKAELIMGRLNNPTKEMIVKLFKSETDLFMANRTSVKPFFEFKIKKFFEENKFSSSTSYMLALTSLNKYAKEELCFEDIDEKFLKGYVSWMGVKGTFCCNCWNLFEEFKGCFIMM